MVARFPLTFILLAFALFFAQEAQTAPFAVTKRTDIFIAPSTTTHKIGTLESVTVVGVTKPDGLSRCVPEDRENHLMIWSFDHLGEPRGGVPFCVSKYGDRHE